MLAAALLVLLAAGCASATSTAAPAKSLALRALTVKGDEVVTFEAVNVSNGRLAITEGFGFDFYFGLEVQDEAGRPIEVSKWELTREPKPRCFAPGESVVIRVPLKAWNPVHGTDATCTEARCQAYPLARGVYRIRAVYRPVRSSALRTRCTALEELVASEWLSFRVE